MMVSWIRARGVILLIAVWFICILQNLHMSCSDTGSDEVQALMAFKNKVSQNDALDSWDGNLVNPCTWIHINCDNDSNVIEVYLQKNELSGPIVPNFGDLKKLQYLDLQNNSLNGTIPPELGNLTELISLNLYDNVLTGPIPKTLGNLKNLRFLRLNDNNLSGRVPVHELVPIGVRGTIDISGNPFLCTNYTSCPSNV